MQAGQTVDTFFFVPMRPLVYQVNGTAGAYLGAQPALDAIIGDVEPLSTAALFVKRIRHKRLESGEKSWFDLENPSFPMDHPLTDFVQLHTGFLQHSILFLGWD